MTRIPTEAAQTAGPGARLAHPDSLLIITADDFGLHPAVNHGVRRAHLHGVLTAASLMVQAPASEPAVAMARNMPDLRVGLHLVLTDGWSSLPPGRYAERSVPGRLDHGMVRESFRFAISRRARKRLTDEIRAQFTKFRQTGLTLDHVNTHKHFHVHPIVLQVILDLGQEFGPFGVRIPAEPAWFAYRFGGAVPFLCNVALSPWIAYMKYCLRAAGHPFNDHVFGVCCSGHLDSWSMVTLLADMPNGITEIYMHPAVRTATALSASMTQYQHDMELDMLLSRAVRTRIRASRIRTGGFADIAGRPVRAPHPADRHSEARR